MLDHIDDTALDTIRDATAPIALIILSAAGVIAGDPGPLPVIFAAAALLWAVTLWPNWRIRSTARYAATGLLTFAAVGRSAWLLIVTTDHLPRNSELTAGLLWASVSWLAVLAAGAIHLSDARRHYGP